MGFREGFGDSLAGFQYMQQQADQGTARRKQNALAGLMGNYAAGGAPDYQGVAANGGDSLKLRDDAQERGGKIAAVIAGAPEAMRPALWKQYHPQIDAIAPGAPPDWTPDILPMVQQYAQQYGGKGAQGGMVQSTYIDAQGNRVATMRDGTTRILGQNAPNVQLVPGEGGYYGVNKGSLSATPVMVGQGPQSPPVPVQAGPQPQPVMFDDATLKSLLSVPPAERATALAAMQADAQGKQFSMSPGADGQPVSNVPAGAVSQPPAQANFGSGRQLQAPQKPIAPRAAPAGYAWQPDGSLTAIPGGPAQAAIDARKAAQDAKQLAQEAKDNVGKVRQAEAAQQASGLVSAIDRLTKSPGFSDLGTTFGDAKIGTPYIRTDAKDADAQLRNVAGQVALTTMSRLKALSATGATGFGSLTHPELMLLENSIAALQSDQISNKELRASLKIVRDSMQKIADWKGGAEPTAPNKPPAGNGWAIEPVQ